MSNKSARETIIELYLSWVNDFLTVAKFAEYHGLTDHQALALIKLGEHVYNSKHPET